jgi:hypothetical protein
VVVDFFAAGIASVAGLGRARDVRLVIGVAGAGDLAGGPLGEVVGRCIVGGFAFLRRDLAMCIARVFLISRQAQRPCLVEPLAVLADVAGVLRISMEFNFEPNPL